MTTSTVVTARARPKESSPAAFGVNRLTRYGSVLVGVDGTPTSRDAIALGARLHEPSGQLTLANVLLTSTPTYQNFHATPAWAERRKMLERERQAAGVAAELTGMASPQWVVGCTSSRRTAPPTYLWSAPAAAGSRVVCSLEMTRAGR